MTVTDRDSSEGCLVEDPQHDLPAQDSAADLHSAWRGVLDDLQAYQRAWLRTSQPVTVHENTAILSVPNEFTRGQLEGKLPVTQALISER